MPLYKCILFQHYSLSWKTYCLHHKCQCLLPFLSVQICIHVSMCMYLASPLLLWLCVSVNEYAFSFSYLCQLVYLFSLSLQMQIYGWVFLRLYLHVYIQGVSKKSTFWCWSGLKHLFAYTRFDRTTQWRQHGAFTPNQHQKSTFFRDTLYLLPGSWSSNSSMASHGPSPTPTRTEEALYQIKLSKSFLPKDFNLFILLSKIDEFLI